MPYKVTKKFAQRGNEIHIGSYSTEAEAKKNIQEKLAEDMRVKVQTIYCLYEGADLIQEFDQAGLQLQSEDSSQQGGQQKGSGQTFSPSPFSTSPRPKGMPVSGFKEENKDKEDKNK